jgi:hypothetical protein
MHLLMLPSCAGNPAPVQKTERKKFSSFRQGDASLQAAAGGFPHSAQLVW